MPKSYELITELLLELKAKCKVGAIPTELDKFAEEKILSFGAKPFNRGYHPAWAKTPYPNTLCINRKGVIAHGIPTDKPFENGEIITIDTSLIFDGQCADAAFSIGIGELIKPHKNMLAAAKNVLLETIREVIKPSANNFMIGKFIEDRAKKYGYVTCKLMGGHGIGAEMHEKPSIPSFNPFREKRVPVQMATLQEGQIICIEPMLTKHDPYGRVAADGWTYETTDGHYSVFFEHMVLITKTGAEILTKHI